MDGKVSDALYVIFPTTVPHFMKSLSTVDMGNASYKEENNTINTCAFPNRARPLLVE